MQTTIKKDRTHNRLSFLKDILDGIFVRVIVGSTLLLAATGANAVTLTDEVLFQTEGQSMFSSGASGTVSVDLFVGLKWGTFRERLDFLGFQLPRPPEEISFGGFIGGASENVCIGIDGPLGCAGFRTDIDTTTGLEATLKTSGQVGVNLGIDLFGGGVDIDVPIAVSVALPDLITEDTFFTVTTDQLTHMLGANITANAPSFGATLDGVFDVENEFIGEACFFGECTGGTFNADVNLGEFPLLALDSTSETPWTLFGEFALPIEFLGKKTIRLPTPGNPDGIDETGPPDPNPLKPPILIEAELKGLQNQSGGTVIGDHITLQTNNEVLDIQVSLTGILETFFPIAAGQGVLKNRITLVDGPGEGTEFDIKLEYTIANVSVGPVLGMRQDFDLDPKAAVRLEFDKPITRIERVLVGTEIVCIGNQIFNCLFGTLVSQDVFENLPVTHQDGIIEIMLGDSAQLKFEDGVGQLISRTWFLSDPTLRNNTSLTLAVRLAAQFMCIGITGLGEGCLFDEDATSDPFVQSVFDRTFTIGGFNEVSFAEVLNFTGQPGPTPPDEPVTAVPEPSSLALVLIGLIGIVAARSRRQLRACLS